MGVQRRLPVKKSSSVVVGTRHESAEQPMPVRKGFEGASAVGLTDLMTLQRHIGNANVQHLIVQRSVDAGVIGSGPPIQRARITVIIDGKPHTFDDGKGDLGPFGHPTSTEQEDKPIPIFDVKRNGRDLMNLVGNRKPSGQERAFDPDAFTPAELEALAEEQEFRRLPERYNRVADELDARYQALQSKLTALSKDASALGLPNPLMQDLMQGERSIEKALVQRPHEIYLRRFEIEAEIGKLEHIVAEREARAKEIGAFIPQFRSLSASMGADLDFIGDMLEQNLKIKGRKDYLRVSDKLQEKYDELSRQGYDAIAGYERPKAASALSATIKGLTALKIDVEGHGAAVEDANEWASGGLGKGSGAAKTISMAGTYGKIVKSVYDKLDNKLLPDRKLQELLDSTTTGEGGQGVKALSGKIKGGYTHELKFLGKLGGNRIFGRLDPGDGRVLFTKYGAHL